MKAVAGTLPAGDGWVHEVKWDGMRAVVTIDGDAVSLSSANGRDTTRSFPELQPLGGALGVGDAVLDGEIVALDESGRPDFGALQSRMHVTDPRLAAERAHSTPCVLMLFDLLALDGRDVTGLPLEDRRHLLESLVPPGPHWQVPAVHADGAALLAAATDRGLEGIVAKRLGSRYTPGSRTNEWVKVKVRRHQEFVVGGWGAGSGGRSGRIGGLLVGYHDVPGGPLRYAGRVGSGLTGAEIDRLHERFAPLEVERCPFEPAPPRPHVAGVTWVRPEVVVEVAFAEWTGEGRLRHPAYLGERTDTDAAAVTADP